MLVLGASLPAEVLSQGDTRPNVGWRTVETKHFRVHYAASAEPWALEVARRLDAVHDAVARVVGHAPHDIVEVVIDDPNNVSNGSASPLLEAPVMTFWPTPPGPTSAIGSTRGWSEILAVHEFAHIAHLTIPARSPRDRAIIRLLPYTVSPMLWRSPRWAIEGYATYVEGRLTGHGRPHGALRPMVLRQWALEGRLPTYGQLNGSAGFYGGSMAYLTGSAFLEWLVARHGEQSLPNLWRRMTARQRRSFDVAFIGVFGDSPADLYGRFVTEVTGQALAAERQLDSAGLYSGNIVQRLTWNTGEPALSADGRRIATVLRAEAAPPRVVIWPRDSQPQTEKELKAIDRIFARDTLDVRAVRKYPRPRKPLATLYPRNGRSFDEPRFFADTERVLLVRSMPLADGTLRPDLYEWNYRRGSVRRVTRGAGVRGADPSPDGRSAVATRCRFGVCDLVRVDLASGAVRTIVAGAVGRSHNRPRYSPDGRSVVVGVQERGHWRVAVTDDQGAPLRYIEPGDAADRFTPGFSADGKSLIVVSERTGTPNLERIDLATLAVQPLTRLTSGAFMPDVSRSDSSVLYLRVHAKGLDLYELRLDSAQVVGEVALVDSALQARRRPVVPADTFAIGVVSAPRTYGMGPRGYAKFPGGGSGREGGFATLAVSSTDPVGRFSWLAQGALGERSTWRGGSLAGTWRGSRPSVTAELFLATHEPTRRADSRVATPVAIDATIGGGHLSASLVTVNSFGSTRATAGVAQMTLRRPASAGDGMRLLGYGELGSTLVQSPGQWTFREQVIVHAAAGRTPEDVSGMGSSAWQRGVGSVVLQASRRTLGVELAGSFTGVSRRAPSFEHATVGGLPSPLLASSLLSQRTPMPALPFMLQTDRLATYRVGMLSGGFAPYLFEAYVDKRTRVSVLGVDQRLTMAGIPAFRVPAFTLVFGAGYPTAGGLRRRVHPYVSATLRP